MIYPYKCPKCGNYTEEVRCAKDYRPEIDCDACGAVMQRVFTASAVKVPNLEGYNAALGCPNRETRRKIKELNSKGMDIQEMGNERHVFKPVEKSYDLSRNDINRMNQQMGWA
jgi:putative FmdB family regulatory protein